MLEPLPTRDHTEILLDRAGARVRRKPGRVTVAPVERLELGDVEIPGDFSSAAPLLVAATLLAGSELTVHGVNLNPRRTGLLDVLERMGANVSVLNRRRVGGEAVGDLDVRSAELVGTTIGAKEVPLLVDELPLFALLAVHARGDSVLRGAAELRAKETDRIEAVVDGLRPSARTSARPTTASRFAASRAPARRRARRPRRPPDRDARSGRRARVPRGRGRRGRRVRGGKLPRFLSTCWTSLESHQTTDDRRDRRPSRSGQEHGRTAARRAARLPLPRHGSDVPRAHVARAAARRRARPRRRLAALAREHPVEFDDAGRVFIDGTDVTASIRRPDIDKLVPVVARHPQVREVMRDRQRALGQDGNVVIEGRDIGTVVAPGAQVKVYLVADDPSCAPRAAPRNGPESAPTRLPPTCGCATSGTPRTCSPPRTPCRSTPPSSRWTKWSSGSRRSCSRVRPA